MVRCLLPFGGMRRPPSVSCAFANSERECSRPVSGTSAASVLMNRYSRSHPINDQEEGIVVKPSLIVCPVEFSASGNAALGQALSLAQWHGAELHVLYVQRGRVRRDISTATSTANPVHSRLEDFVSALKPEGVDVVPVVLTGDAAKNGAEYARVNAADLLVVGQHGRRGTRFWSSGVLANDLARDVPCPTLTVPGEPLPDAKVDPSFRNIVCAIDFSPAAGRFRNSTGCDSNGRYDAKGRSRSARAAATDETRADCDDVHRRRGTAPCSLSRADGPRTIKGDRNDFEVCTPS